MLLGGTALILGNQGRPYRMVSRYVGSLVSYLGGGVKNPTGADQTQR